MTIIKAVPFALMVLAGCTSVRLPEELPLDHPANPCGAVSALPESTGLLRSDEETTQGPESASPRQHGHEGHQGMDSGKSKHGGHH